MDCKKIMIMFVFLVLLSSGCTEQEQLVSEPTPEEVEKAEEQELFASESTFEEAQEIVEQWITSMPTYSFDGSNLTLVEHIREDTLPSTHLLIYTFTSSHEGYGDRSDEMLTESATNHTIWVTFSQREIRKAIIDESWDEIQQVAV